MPTVLPPGVSAANFAAAVKEFQAAVGAEWVFTTEEDLHAYRDPYSLRWDDADEYLASAAVAPQEVEQVQAIVRTANKYKIPLYPIATGKNLTYGGAAPTFTGSVVLDMKRMNRVLKVDEKRHFALVEPGVAYFDLYRYIQDRKLKLWIDCADPGWGSPIGNALDHGVGYTAAMFRDHFGAHCGMEVVLPNGDLMRTGMGALPNADSWQDYRYGVGPYVDGLFAQSNFGIVTKMGFWLMPQPEAWLAGVASAPNHSDLQKLVEECSYLEDLQITTGQPGYTSTLGGPADNADLKALMANGWPTDAQIDAYVKKRGGPAWNLRLQFYGGVKTVQANWEYAQERIAKAIPGVKFQLEAMYTMPLTAEQEKTAHLTNFGIPNMIVFNSIGRKATDPANMADGHSDFFAVCPRDAGALHRVQKVIYDTQKQLGVPTTATPFNSPVTWYHRTFLMSAPTVQNYRDDREKNKRGRELFTAYLTNTAQAGFGAYRTNPGMQDLLVSQYSFGDHALLKFQQTMKDGIDPNGIISPGRYGIWPKHLRKDRA